jgi:hypothetical protein
MKQFLPVTTWMVLLLHTKIGALFVRSPNMRQRHYSSPSWRSFLVDHPHSLPNHHRQSPTLFSFSNDYGLWSVHRNNVHRRKVLRSLSTVRASPVSESLAHPNFLDHNNGHNGTGGQPLTARERYNVMMGTLLSINNLRILGAKKHRVTETEHQEVANYLLAETQVFHVSSPPAILNTTTTKNDPEVLRNAIYQHRGQFCTAANFSKNAYDYCSRCLIYMGDLVAKQSDPDVGVLAWKKIREIGLLPREITMATFLYVFSAEQEQQPPQEQDLSSERFNASLEAAILCDTFSKPTEATLTIRVKSLVSRGQVEAAEQLIANADDTIVVRLRTFFPLLQHYCSLLDSKQISRIYQSMRSCDGVYFDADSFCLLLGAMATLVAQHPTEDHVALFQYFANEMADTLLEINQVAANRLIEIVHGKAGFLASRVMINENATCPDTGAKLRLFTLSQEQRRVLHDTLLDMAAQKVHSTSYVRSKSGNELSPECRLREFSRWLKYRPGEPYTVIIDGPNIAYYGRSYIDWKYIERLVHEVERMGETPLVIMPTRYTSPTFRLSDGSIQHLDEDGRRIILELSRTQRLYVVPGGSLDDYYWMLSSVGEQNSTFLEYISPEDGTQRFPGLRPLLITNDQMRDHRLELLEPRLFRRWTSCHVVKYRITNETVHLYPAHFYSQEIQCNEAARYANQPVWHIPVAEWANRERLCIGINIRPDTESRIP